ncbi:MAG: hypothetical protein M1831_004530 [Alyxoria varia]|nr:MAG: hypothetical protein M1831_004530 [Alyxoria varia]
MAFRNTTRVNYNTPADADSDANEPRAVRNTRADPDAITSVAHDPNAITPVADDPDAITTVPGDTTNGPNATTPVSDDAEEDPDVEGTSAGPELTNPPGETQSTASRLQKSISGRLTFGRGTKVEQRPPGTSAYKKNKEGQTPRKPSTLTKIAESTGVGVSRSEKDKKIYAKHEKDRKMLFGANDPNKPGTEERGKKMSDREAKLAQERAREETPNRVKRWWYKFVNILNFKRRPNTTDVDESVTVGTPKH